MLLGSNRLTNRAYAGHKHLFLGASTTHVSAPNYQTFTIRAYLGFVGSRCDPWYRNDFVAVLAMYQKVPPRSKLKTISARQTLARCVSKQFLWHPPCHHPAEEH